MRGPAILTERRAAIGRERRRGAGGGAERLALGLGRDGGGIGAERVGRAIVRAGAGLVEREIGRGMLGPVLLRSQEDGEQRTAEPDCGGADRERIAAERLGLGLAVRLVGVAVVEFGHGLVRCCWFGRFNGPGRWGVPEPCLTKAPARSALPKMTIRICWRSLGRAVRSGRGGSCGVAGGGKFTKQFDKLASIFGRSFAERGRFR